MKILTNYKEIITMFYLSKLIYDYHENDNFNLNINESINNYLVRVNTEFNNGIHNNIFINIKNCLLFLSNNYPNSLIYDFISNEKTDIQCGLVLDKNSNSLSIVFKGTDSLINCYYDLLFLKRHIDLKNVQIHNGFFDQIISIYDELINKIKNILLLYKKLSIFITGHSAGAGQGTIFAYLLSKIYTSKIIKLITFGGPKIGNFYWYEEFNKIKNIIHYRITNEGDIITKIPNLDYYHVGINIHLTTYNVHVYKDPICCSNDYCEKECCTNYENDTVNECCIGNILSKFNYLNINNHKIDYYFINLINKKEIIDDICSHKQFSL
jgi:hypothetical protein